MNSSNSCPCCGRHCPQEDLHCTRGRAYFGVESGKDEPHMRHGRHPENMSADDMVIELMRGCGHYLHHSAGKGEADNAQLLSVLSEDEKRELISLLKKCIKSWNNAG